MKTHETARLHEHAGRIAIWIGDTKGTVYISTALAEKLAKELALAANQIKNGNHYPVTEINREA
mgnify:CR=1 FL=1